MNKKAKVARCDVWKYSSCQLPKKGLSSPEQAQSNHQVLGTRFKAEKGGMSSLGGGTPPFAP